MDRTAGQDRFLWIARTVFDLFFHVMARVEVIGRENLEVDGSCLVVMNHLSVFDPVLLLTLLPRNGWALAAEKYRRYPILGPFLHGLGAIFVRRGEVDRRALRAALKVLREGGLMGLAPEGTRSKTGQLQQAKDGAAYLASRTGATIVPVAIIGTEKMSSALKRLRRGRVRIVVGEPFKLPSANGPAKGPQLAAYTDLIMRRLAALLPEPYQGFYRNRCFPEGTPLPVGD